MLTRRQLLQGLTAATGTLVGLSGYALAEPWQLGITRYRITPAGWPAGLKVRLAVVADLHVCEPWMGVDRVEGIVARTNAMAPDAVLLLGDYRANRGMMRFSHHVPDEAWAGVLATFKAPLGTHAVLGNHDWWDDPELQLTRRGPTRARVALERAGVPVYENDAVRLIKDGQAFWIAGLGDQWAFWRPREGAPVPRYRRVMEGVHDLPATLAKITDDAPVILMAHEPDIFAKTPARVALTVSGHTHGGQIRLGSFAPVVPSAYGRRYVYGHIVEDGRNLIVSAGLGCSGFPLRFGAPPEIVIVEFGDWHASPVVQS